MYMTPIPTVNPFTRPPNVNVVVVVAPDADEKKSKAKRPRVRADWREAELLGFTRFPMSHTVIC